ncbi:MAG: Rne/Rng family ribonuclease [Lentisphaeria bacterium]
MKQLIINSEGLETRVALVEDNKLQNYFIERADEHRLVGSIFKGVVRNLEPSLQAAFVNIGAPKNAFLHYWDMLPATEDVLEEEEPKTKNPPEEKTDSQYNEEPERTGREDAGWFGKLRGKMLKLQEKKRKDSASGNGEGNNNQKGGRSRKGGRNKNKARKVTFTVDDIPELFPVNSEVLVQVTKGPIGTKGARVTTNLSIPGRYLVFLPNSSHVGVSKKIASKKERQRLRNILRNLKLPKGTGVICRTVGAGKTEEMFHQDIGLLLEEWKEAERLIKSEKGACCVYEEPHIAERSLRDYLTEDVDEIVVDSKAVYDKALQLTKRFAKGRKVKVKEHKSPVPLFDKYNLTRQIENMFRRQVALPSGGYICIDETEALIAVDVNSGKARGGKDHPETILNTNLEAAEQVARQLRLRNLGGLIVVDFIDMRSKDDRKTVYHAFKDALSGDKARTKVTPISPLGLIEMTRQREHESLLETVFTECPYCSGKGLVKSPKSISVEIQRMLQSIMRRGKDLRIRVQVHPDVLQRLRKEDAELLSEMETEWGGELSFRADPSLHYEEFRMIDLKRNKEI